MSIFLAFNPDPPTPTTLIFVFDFIKLPTNYESKLITNLGEAIYEYTNLGFPLRIIYQFVDSCVSFGIS
jgi:hypothetical protein